ncbi:MAG: zf-TFIIB domain-containing protein [Actinomycetota bacterium]|nr:zf-TFIIB domain-containing protein [Actinomycetota bacterium]
MDCPLDGTELRIADRSGVEIDYCPKCRGVWLDRGELDKIIDRAGAFDESYDYARTNAPKAKAIRRRNPRASSRNSLNSSDDWRGG